MLGGRQYEAQDKLLWKALCVPSADLKLDSMTVTITILLFDD